MRMSQNLDFLFADSFPIFFSLLFFPFFSPFLFPLSSRFYPLSIHWKSLVSALEKAWKRNIDQQLVTWPILPPILHPKLDTFFWNSSVRICLMLKIHTSLDGSVLAVLAAYQNNLVTSK